MTKTLKETIATVSTLEKQIKDMESIISSRHYGSMPARERYEFDDQLTRQKEQLSIAIKQMIRSEHAMEA